MKLKSDTVVVYKPNFLDDLVAGRGREFEDAKKRVQTTGGYKYTPSDDYKKFKANSIIRPPKRTVN